MLSPLTILMIVVVIAAIGTWVIPAGQYSKLSVNGNNFVLTGAGSEVQLPYTQHTLDSLGMHIALEKFTNGDLRKPVSVPGTFQQTANTPQGFIQVLQAPVKGIHESIDIILFILTIGGFMFVITETGAVVKGITWLATVMKGREPVLIVLLTTIFSFFAASYGMAEEALIFYPLLVPLFLGAGYDLMVPLAIIFGGTTIGVVSAFSNPFSTIIASNAAGINWADGLYQRLAIWAGITAMLDIYILRYAARVKKDPSRSIVLKIDGNVAPAFAVNLETGTGFKKLDLRTKLLLFIYIATFLGMIAGVVFFGWWTLEMSALFIGASILVAVISRMKEKVFIREFLKGAESLLSVAFIVGVARGVTVVLNDGHISDSILYYAAGVVGGMPPAVFILLLLVFYFFFSIFISSTSGMAVLTMPIIGALAIIVNLPGKEVVNAYQYGMNIMAFLTPTGLILPNLAIINVSYKAWLKFIMPLLVALVVLCVIFLLAGIW
ncbi:YfcC family protein [Flavihumibacter petaseus]|nr:YfcC family protein [Flavihumibacter petaseus]